MITVYTEDACGSPVMMSDVVYPEVWCEEILRIAGVTGVPVHAYVDQVKVGKGLAGLGVKPLPCVVVQHKEKPNKYVKMVGALDKIGNITYASKYLAGSSTSIRLCKAANAVSGGMKAATGDGSSFVASILGKLAQRGQQQEEMFYDAAHAIMQEALDNVQGVEPPIPVPPIPAPPPVKPTTPARPPVKPPVRTPAPPKPQPKPAPQPKPKPTAKPTVPTKAQPARVMFSCPKCAKKFRIEQRNVYITFTCTQCGHVFRVNCSKNS